MLVLFITSAQFSRTEDGFHIVFGQIQAELDQAQLDSLSAAMESSQIESLRAVLASLETVRAEEHRLLTQAVMEQTREFSAENLDLIVTWVEQQHRLNMESLQAGFEQLLDSDMNTLLAMEQLASFVQYREEVR
jgi:hypothetical protein